MPRPTPKDESEVGVFARRLRAAREMTGLSQKALGIQAGIDEFVASARVNQYERGTHMPDYSMARQLAQAVGVPVAYLYSDSDEEARLLLVFNALNKRERGAVLKELEGAS